MKCQNCGTELENGVLFCRECGNKVENQKAFCRECGSQITDSSKFCSSCGVNLKAIDDAIIDSAINSVAKPETQPVTEAVMEEVSVQKIEQPKKAKSAQKTEPVTFGDKVSAKAVAFWDSLDIFCRIVTISLVVLAIILLVSILAHKNFAIFFSILQIAGLIAALLMHKNVIKVPKRYIKYLVLIAAITFTVLNIASFSWSINTKKTPEPANLTVNPSLEYVVAALYEVDTITCIEIGDNQAEVGTIYFRSSLVDDKFDSNSPAEIGTKGGGSIDVYSTVRAAEDRDEYLDDLWIFNPGVHTVEGSLVIRISEKLSSEEQEELTQAIIQALTSGEITSKKIEKAMEKYETLQRLEKPNPPTNETRPAETKPVETKPVETKPVETKPVETKPVETKPVETKPVETKPETAGAPDDWTNLLEKHYEEVKKQFEDAGFTNITCVAHEIDFNEDKVFEGSVVNIAVGKDGDICTFEKGEQWPKDIKIRIDYRVKPSEPNSEYEKAFIRALSSYDLYYMFDIDTKTVVYFGTNDTYIEKGTYTGDFATGVTITWAHGEWTEKFTYKSGNNATLIDGNGWDWEYKVCDVEKAQKVLDGLE